MPLATLVRVAGSRWRVEETFQSGKGLAGLDEHQGHRYASWSRLVTLAMLAHAFLAVVRADEHARHPAPDALTPLTNQIQRLFITVVIRPVHDTAHRLSWSYWRRRHQARSQAGHYGRQAAQALASFLSPPQRWIAAGASSCVVLALGNSGTGLYRAPGLARSGCCRRALTLET